METERTQSLEEIVEQLPVKEIGIAEVYREARTEIQKRKNLTADKAIRAGWKNLERNLENMAPMEVLKLIDVRREALEDAIKERVRNERETAGNPADTANWEAVRQALAEGRLCELVEIVQRRMERLYDGNFGEWVSWKESEHRQAPSEGAEGDES